MINRVGLLVFIICAAHMSFSQTGDDDFYLGHGFNSGDTVYTNSGTFWDAGGLAPYNANEEWTVMFCSNNGNPITFDFSDFATDYRGTFPNPPPGEFRVFAMIEDLVTTSGWISLANRRTSRVFS